MDSRRLDDKLVPAMEEADIAQVWRGVKEARAERAPARRRGWVIGVGVAAIAAASVVAIVVAGGGGRSADRRTPEAVGGARETGSSARETGSSVADPGGSVAVPAPLAPVPLASASLALEAGVRVKPDAERSIAMDYGSVIALAAASELEVLANEGDKFVTAVRKGWAHFDVKPGGARRWVVETDLATVEVVGTAFVVERSDERLTVTVERGVVLVRGERVPGRVVRLIAGETLEVPVRAARPQASGPEPSTAPPMVPVPAAEGAIARADALLARGKAIDAADELDRFLDDAGHDAGAGLAAFMLGRIAQDQLGDPERAAAAFARTLAIGSPRAVQDEARARRARTLAAAGRTE